MAIKRNYKFSLDDSHYRLASMCQRCSQNSTGFCTLNEKWCYIARKQCDYTEVSFLEIESDINGLPSYNDLPKSHF